MGNYDTNISPLSPKTDRISRAPLSKNTLKAIALTGHMYYVYPPVLVPIK